MQTAVDCNGSSNSSNSNTGTISTTITTTQKETENDATTMTQHMLVQATANTAASNTNTNTTTEHAEAPMSVLRHRMTAASSNNSYGAMKSPKNGLTHLIDASDYLGSNSVDCMSMQDASPSKRDKCKVMDTVELVDASATSAATVEACKTNTNSSSASLSLSPSPTPSPSPDSCSSKTTSNSTSTTSSVIATPILKRNGNVFKDMGEDNTKPSAQAQDAVVGSVAADAGGPDDDDGQGCANASKVCLGAAGDADAAIFRDCSKQQQQQQKQKQQPPQQLIKNQMLPFENTSSIANKQELSSGPSLLATMSSSTTSSSINSNSNASNATMASLSSSTPSPSPSSSSTSSITPASATTPALLSPSSTATSTASSSPVSSTSAAAIASSAPSALKDFSISGAVDDADLLQWQDMPQYLQFNPYVLKGYRPLQTFKGCLLSLFYWHNETINILTHAIPIVYILAIVPGLMPWESGYRFLSFCHVFGSVAPWCGSFVYHLFMNIERGENVYYTLLKLDMVGIWVSQSFGALPLVTATTFCFSTKWKWLIIISYCLFSLWGLYKALTASSPWQRRLCFALPFTMRSILTFFRTVGVVGGNPIALPHVYLQDAVSIIGGAIGAMRIPEKWFPGLVDYYLNSHNIMHVLVVLAVYSMHMATIKDFEWMSTTNCEAFTNATSKVLESTLKTNIEL